MNALIGVIIKYKYLALFPLAAIEGPVISLIIGFLVHGGYLSFGPSYVVLLLGDLVPDTAYYYLGRYGTKTRLAQKYTTGDSIIARNFGAVEKLWKNHGRKTMILSKLAYGLSTPFLISAGMVQMPIRKFIEYAFPITIVEYAVLMTVGYYLGSSYQLAEKYVTYAGVAVAGVLLIAFVTYVYFLSRYARKSILKLEEEQ